MKKNIFISSIILISILILDLISKSIVKINNIQTNNGLVDITYRTNVGSLFNLFANLNYINIIFIFLSLIALGFLFYLWKKEKNYFISITLISAGILGNLIDRIFYGFVVDWINFHFWPVFNVADSAIVIGLIYFGYLLLKENYSTKKIKNH
ncbi:MAG: signal peptidase II [Candidatus Woesearchaeota archaeon]